MAAQNTAGSDRILLSAAKTKGDYRLSLALLLAGAVVVVADYGFVFLTNAMSHSSIATTLLFSTIGNIGFVLITVGAIFAAINWSLLRKSRHNS